MQQMKYETFLQITTECGCIDSFEPCETHDAFDYCEVHDLIVTVMEADSFLGYAGGRCYTTTLSCGCTTMDDSNDMWAAQ